MRAALVASAALVAGSQAVLPDSVGLIQRWATREQEVSGSGVNASSDANRTNSSLIPVPVIVPIGLPGIYPF
eukprot:CAMPEP_0171180998 /NCGR_PEP_ID=MMETSP0790-20130122/14039_1 /TAXON_ID=2925 /ORGANISM="Alexandrium catenella, Strain OF101" /LENGTH=71 /DNA_ID=CAMNT_0011645935 /DNA_START=61 /DNA_END=273 /DNA_ORIENTATION=-